MFKIIYLVFKYNEFYTACMVVSDGTGWKGAYQRSPNYKTIIITK